MKRLELTQLFREAEAYGGKTVTVCGWVRTLRSSKALGFIELNDGSCFKNLQVVFQDGQVENFKEIAKLNVGTALSVEGEVVLTPEAKQPLEIHAASISVEGPSSPEYPLQKKRHSMEYLRTIAHLRPRANTFNAAFRVRSVAAFALHRFFNENGFVYAHTPIITGSDCEGAGEMFHITTLDLSGGKLQHPPPRGRVLDAGAGDRLCRFERQHGPGGGDAQIRHPLCAGQLPRRDGLLQQLL